MEYTEAVKKEAEEVVRKYIKILYPNLYNPEYTDTIARKLAVQDRQSVLDRCKCHYQLVKENMKSTLQRATVCSTITHEIQSLTNQIEYLKSKI